MDLITYAMAKKYVADTANALGAVKGAPCTIKSIVEEEDGSGSIITFQWTGDDGAVNTSDLKIKNGLGNHDIEISSKDDTTYIESVEVTADVQEDIQCTKTVTTVGNETTTVIIANEDSSDPSVLAAGDVISVVTKIGDVVVFEYHFGDDSTIVSPFD